MDKAIYREGALNVVAAASAARARDLLEHECRREGYATQGLDARYGRQGAFRAKKLPLYVGKSERSGRARRVETGCAVRGFKTDRDITEAQEAHLVDIGRNGEPTSRAWCGMMVTVLRRQRWSRSRAMVTCPACKGLVAQEILGRDEE